MKLWRLAATAVAVSAVLLAWCTGCSGPGRQERASALCAKATGTASHVVASFATTVGEVVSWKAGPGEQPALASWGTYAASDFAAWCWLGTTDNKGDVVATSEGKPDVTFAQGDFAAMPPSQDGPAIP